MRELKFALRRMLQSPFVTVVAVASLALGIGANAAIFSMFDQILLEPLPVPEPERLVNLSAPGPKAGSTSCGAAGDCDDVFSYPMFRDLQAGETGFDRIAAHVSFGANIASGTETVAGNGMYVSGSYFPTLGLDPALGRLLDSVDDERPGQSWVTVLAHDFWTARLGSDPAVLNSTIVVNGESLTVVGVAPEGFEGTTLGEAPDLFVPLSMRGVISGSASELEDRRRYWIYLFGRLAPGVELETAAERIGGLYSNIVREVEAPLQTDMSDDQLRRFRQKSIELGPGYRGQSSVFEEASTPLFLLLAVTGTVLLIAGANVANLLIALGAKREAEMAVRSALGADRGRLLRQVLLEAVVLALLGGAVSLAVAWATLTFITGLLPPEISAALGLELQPGILIFTAVVSVVAGLIFGMFPALHTTRSELLGMVKTAGARGGGSRAAARFRAGLVMGQVTLSMALLVMAGLFLKSLANVTRVDLGLEAERMVTFTIEPGRSGYESEERLDLYRRVTEQMEALPGVTRVSTSMVPVLAGSRWNTMVSVEGIEWDPERDMSSSWNDIGPGYFSTMGIPLLAGREFDVRDDANGPRVVIVNEAFTRKFGLDGASAVGKRMSRSPRAGELDMEIVGVVPDSRYADVKDAAPPVFFSPWAQNTPHGGLTFYLRTTGDETEVLRAVPPVVREIAPDVPVENLVRFEDQVRENVFLDRFLSILASAFALLATTLAAIGLYGVLSYTVEQRTREIGIRMALGAEASRVRTMVLSRMGRMVGIGAFLGAGIALWLGRVAQSLLYEIEGAGPAVVFGAGMVIILVALLAAYMPARRASRVDPMESLRYE